MKKLSPVPVDITNDSPIAYRGITAQQASTSFDVTHRQLRKHCTAYRLQSTGARRVGAGGIVVHGEEKLSLRPA